MSQHVSDNPIMAKTKSAEWIVRPMRHGDICRCLEIWRQVELTEAHQTVASHLTTDPNGFYVAELVPDGLVIGMCAGPMTRDDTAFMGFYAVDPQYQSIGIGRELWSKTIGRLEGSANVGLYGVPAMAAKYKRSGFKLEDSIRMLIFESNPEESHKLNIDQLKDIDHLQHCRLELIDWQTNDTIKRKLIAYDEQLQQFSREKLLNNYLFGSDVPITLAIVRTLTGANDNEDDDNVEQDQSIRRAGDQQSRDIILGRNQGDRKLSCCTKPSQESIIEDETLGLNIRNSLSISENNFGDLQARSTSPIDIPSIGSQRAKMLAELDIEIQGYGCIRHDNTSGGMIGPIYADSPEICEILLKNLLQKYKLKPGAKYSVMSLTSNESASVILKKIGLIEVDQCTRMFTKFIPAASLSKIYYVHSPNFTLF